MNELTLHPSVAPSSHEMSVYQTMAKQAANSKMYRGIGDENGLIVIMLAARELGIPPLQALNGGLHLIQGKVEISARMMSALIRKGGHSITVKECSDEVCVLVGKRADNGDQATVEYSFEEAKTAGLVKKGGGWEKHTKDMLFARALSRLSRQLFSDVVGVGYVEGEISKSDAKPSQIAPEELQEATEDLEAYKTDALKDVSDDMKDAYVEWLEKVRAHFKWSQADMWRNAAAEPEEYLKKFNDWRAKDAAKEG